jgi:predicted transcriptional regulator
MSENLSERELLDRLAKVTSDITVRAHARKLRRRLKLPMSAVLVKVEGKSVVAKAAIIGVSRQTVYQWLTGISRPSLPVAKKLEKLTGYDAADIRGRDA